MKTKKLVQTIQDLEWQIQCRAENLVQMKLALILTRATLKRKEMDNAKRNKSKALQKIA